MFALELYMAMGLLVCLSYCMFVGWYVSLFVC